MTTDLVEKGSIEEECLVFQKLNPRLKGNFKLLDVEAGLFRSKWFDYRFMTPFEATTLYARMFETVYRQFYGKVFDRDRAEHIRPLKVYSILDLAPGKLTALWRGRQFADAIGMPYPLYLTLAYTQTLRFWKRPHLPQPQHLYSDRLVGYFDKETGEGIVGEIQKGWEERQAARLYIAEDARYANDNYAGVAAQNDHHEWLFTQAYKRENPIVYLADFVSRDILPEAKVRARLSADDYARFRSFS